MLIRWRKTAVHCHGLLCSYFAAGIRVRSIAISVQGSVRMCVRSDISTRAVAEMGAIDMGRKVGGAAVSGPLSGRGELGPHLTQCGLG